MISLLVNNDFKAKIKRPKLVQRLLRRGLYACIGKPPVAPKSKLVHRYLLNLHGIEIGGSTQSPFYLPKCINVDFSDTPGQWQSKSFKKKPVNIVASGDDIPFKDSTLDYVLSSHVLEHFFDPIKALFEWRRIVKPGGYIIMIVPHKDRMLDREKATTTLTELIERHQGKLKISDYIFPDSPEAIDEVAGKNYHKTKMPGWGSSLLPKLPHELHLDENIPHGWKRFSQDDHHHWSIWKTEDILELCRYLELDVIEYQDIDDRDGSGFTIVIKN